MLSGDHITVRYGNFTAVDDLSFQLHEGEWLMLAGPNGAGKSTLIETIARERHIPEGFNGTMRNSAP